MKLKRLAWFIALFSVLTTVMVGQSVNSTISGAVIDSSGASIPNAEITLTDVGRSSKRTAVSNQEGFYSLPNLTPGNYTLAVGAKGFRQFNQKNISLLLNQQVRQDVQLEVGETSDTITVEANVSAVNFNDAVRQEGVSGRELNELPLVVSGGPRSAASFTVMLPGVSTGGGNNAFDARINGGLQTGQEAIMDGVSMQQGTMSQSGMISFYDFRMTPDMVSEFKVLTSNYEPQYGASTSAQMIVETKSGADAFHGGLFEYLRNEKLNARQFGADSRPIDKEHNFGGFLGGPVKIPLPGIFKGRARTYFYTDIESFRATGGNNRPTLTVPTAAMKRGDFSEWKDGDGRLIPVYDPQTTRRNPTFQSGLPEGPNNLPYLRDQFMGCNGGSPNVICPSRIQNSLAQAWLKFIPDPNRPTLLNNFQVQTPVPDGILANTNYYMGRVDHYMSEKDHFYLTLWHQRAPAKFNSTLPLQLATESFSDPQNSWVNRINWSHTFSPTLLNHWNIGYLNRNEGYGAINTQFASEFPSIKGVADPNTPPQIRFDNNNYQGFGSSNGPNLGNLTTRPTIVTTELLTWIRGNHTFKFGGEYRHLGQDFNSGGNTAGEFNFNRLNTGLVGLSNSGHPFASFLLEQVSSGTVQFRSVPAWKVRSHGYVLHAGDTWKINRRVSLNYGLRWDMFTPSYEADNRFSFFDPDGVNPAAGGLKGRVAFAGSDNGPASYGARFPEETWKKGFAPRIGIAWGLDSKTVVRTGYGIFYTQNYYPGWGGGVSLDGYNTSASFSNTLGGIEPAFILSQGFPQNFPKPPTLDAGVRNGRSALYRPKDANRRPYSQMWNLTIERQLPGSTLASIAYVATKGTRLPSAIIPINALPLQYLASGPTLRDEFQPGQAELGGVRAPYAGWAQQLRDAGCAPSVAQALLPYPQYCDGLRGLNENAGNSTYHSFQAKLEKRFSQGLYTLMSYTWSRLITDVQSTNPDANTGGGAVGIFSPFERQRNKSLAQDDVPHVFSAAVVYELPAGRGKRWNPSNAALSTFLGGWSVNLIQKLQSGTPLFFRVRDTCNIPSQFRMGCVPAVLNGKNPLAQDVGSIDVNKVLFDRSAFEPLDAFSSGFYRGVGSRVTNFRGPGFSNTDFSVVKNVPFSVRDRIFNLQIRGEFFNVWNEHHFTTSAGQGDNGAFNRDLSSPEFGKWTGAVTTPRNIQLTARFTF
ncbi:MAG: carboxypeptidase regulatory-like domain-containing protein [Bryobacteraceae bacterium]|nr:carboxypeptidase regulatory-like domain-containing protein [Bryobacteraceae bacterium]